MLVCSSQENLQIEKQGKEEANNSCVCVCVCIIYSHTVRSLVVNLYVRSYGSCTQTDNVLRGYERSWQ